MTYSICPIEIIGNSSCKERPDWSWEDRDDRESILLSKRPTRPPLGDLLKLSFFKDLRLLRMLDLP